MLLAGLFLARRLGLEQDRHDRHGLYLRDLEQGYHGTLGWWPVFGVQTGIRARVPRVPTVVFTGPVGRMARWGRTVRPSRGYRRDAPEHRKSVSRTLRPVCSD